MHRQMWFGGPTRRAMERPYLYYYSDTQIAASGHECCFDLFFADYGSVGSRSSTNLHTHPIPEPSLHHSPCQ